MKITTIRRPLIMWLALFLLSSLWISAMLTDSNAALAQSADGYFWFNPQQSSGHTLTYSMTTTGSIHVQTPDDPGHTATVKLSAYVSVSLDAPDEDMVYPFGLSIFNVEAEGFPEDLASGLSNKTIYGSLSSRGAIIHLETPDVLRQIGVDSLDLFSGFFVPGPDQPPGSNSQWDVSFNRLHLGATRTRTVPIAAFYAHQGIRQWGSRPLQFVTSRIRGTSSWLEGSTRTEVLEVGSGLFYVDPDTGHTTISSVSKITSIDIVEQRIGMVQTRNTLTTTLELLNQPLVIVEQPDSGEIGFEPILTDPFDREERVWLYEDPAGRFELRLPVSWRSAHITLGLRSTTLATTPTGDVLNVRVLPLPSSGASSLTVARLALTTYQETRRGFQIIDDLTPIELDGESAYLVRYAYENEAGQKVTEWAVFTRHKNQAYYVQYTTDDANAWEPSQVTRLLGGFRYGPTPEGSVSPEQLPNSLSAYHDPDGRFSILVPSLWPLIDRAQDGSTTTFSELGGLGYLTVFAQPGAMELTAEDIVTSWKIQSEQESGFELVHDLTPAPLAGHDGLFFEYRWATNADTYLVRRLHATVVDDFLYAIALDYVASGFENRRETFDRIFSSMTLIKEAGATDDTPPPSGVDITPSQNETDEPSDSDATDEVRADREDSEDSVTFSSRILTRYPGADGQPVSLWAAQVEVTIRIGDKEFTAVTDEQGWLTVTGLPHFKEGAYMVTHIRGSLFGFAQAGVNLDNLGFRPDVSNVISAGTIILVMDEEYNIGIELSRDE